METVIRFPLERRIAHDGGRSGPQGEAATVIILPVIRIDRHVDEPSDGLAPGTGTTPGRGRRRRASRS